MSTTTVLPFAGGEMSSFDPLDSGVGEQTSAGVYGTPYDTTVSRCAIAIQATSAGMKSPTWAAAADFWFHGLLFYEGNTGYNGIISLYDGATVVCQAHINNTGDNILHISTLQGGVLTEVGSVTLFKGSNAALNTLDIRVVAGASGRVEAYLEGTQIFQVTGLNHSGFAGVTQFGSQGSTGGYVLFWSQIICDSQPHVGGKLVTIAEDTLSAVNTGWFGPVANINEITFDDSLSVTSDTAGQISTYYKSGATLGSWNIVAVCVGARAQMTPGSSSNLQICIRTNGANYFSATIALGLGLQACCASWTTNPFTVSAWDPATAAIVESGMKSIA